VDGKHVERISRKNMIKPIVLGGFGMIDVSNLDLALKTRQVLRAGVSNHPISIIQGSMTDLLKPFNVQNLNNEPIYCIVKKYIDKYAIEIIKNLTGDSRLNEVNGWVPNVKAAELMRGCKIKGIPMLYAKQLERLGKEKLIQIVDVSLNANHVLYSQAMHIISAIRKLFPHILRIVNPTDNAAYVDHITRFVDGLKAIKINSSTSSKEIRSILDNRSSNANRVIEPKILENLDKPKLMVSLAHLKKTTSVHHKNTMLRILNGDIFCNERMHRFGMIESNNCERCGQIETSKHLLLECPQANQIWSHLTSILNSVNVNFEINLDNILNIGDFTNNRAIITLVAELNAFNTQKNRPKSVTRDIILDKIKSIISREKNHLIKIKSLKQYNKYWRPLENIR
jgi:hypothetical protein